MENQLIREQILEELLDYVRKWDGIYTESDCATVCDEICLRIDQSQFTADEAEEHVNQEVVKRIKEITKANFINTWASEWDERTGWKVSEEYHKQISEQLEYLINQEVEKRIAETVAGKFIAVEIEKRIADRFPSKEEILKYFNNHFNCYTDVTIRDYETTEIAMTNIAVLKMFEWFRNRIKGGE